MINKDIKITIITGVVCTVALSGICFFIKPICAALCLFLGLLLTTIFHVYTRQRYNKLSELNDYLSLVCAGNYDLALPDNTEGELSILKNNLYKVISILNSQNALLKKDKLYLADSLADISHQLKTPLTSITVMTDLLRNESSQEKRDEFITVTEAQLDKMSWLITNLLKLSRLDAGTAVIKKEPTSSLEVIKASMKAFELISELKGIRLDNTVEDFALNIDRAWTIEAIQNIIKNCIEHTDTGGVITISGERTNIYDMIKITDTGCGIAEKDLPHIFERFYHGENSSADSVGIGLALAKAVLERENARISVKSKAGKGTEFEIKFYKGII